MSTENKEKDPATGQAGSGSFPNLKVGTKVKIVEPHGSAGLTGEVVRRDEGDPKEAVKIKRSDSEEVVFVYNEKYLKY